ncbi:MAG: phage terminase large subunit [Planctomycetes bacterium]|nr:phage terminase large subunit [Planctomycetota bacterium]
MKIYLPTLCALPFSSMHCELIELLEKATRRRRAHLAFAAPRGHAKSTLVTLAYVLWCILYGKEKFVLIFSETQDQAVQLLKHVKDELQTNLLLLADFPEVCRPRGAKPRPWRDNRIQLGNGAMIAAYGACQNPRGTRHGPDRPGLIIADDLEEHQQALFEEQRRKLDKWFHRTVLKTGHPQTNVVVVGTIVHHDSLLAKLTAPASGWTARIYAAIKRFSDEPQMWEKWTAFFRGDEESEVDCGPDAARAYYEANSQAMLADTEVLWPELEDYYALMVVREQEGQASFMAEKQNQPLDPAQCTFQEQNFHYWDDDYPDADALCKGLGQRGYFVAACDPALGTRRGDYTAIVVVYHADDKFYVIAADIARRTPEEMLTRLVEFGLMYPLRIITVESNNFQELLAGLLRKALADAGLTVHVRELNSQKKKRERIAILEPLVTQGQLLLSRRQHTLLEQLVAFPFGRHDDGPDALEMAVQTVRVELWGDRLPVVGWIKYTDL